MYKAIVRFTDLQDGNFKYEAGDEFPRQGLEVSATRIKELSTKANKRGVPVIKKVTKKEADAE